jgi:Zn-dependent alcohol dehydrogenase
VDRGRITAADTVVVLGCGMIGMGAVIGAVARGARVIAVDFCDKTGIARNYGATHSIDPGTEDVAARVMD